SGTLRGSGNPSATVNLVRKRPTRDFQGSARVTLGSWDRTRVEADVSGALVESGAIRGRVVAVSDDKEFFQKARHEDKKVVYGVFEADLGTRTTATLSLQYTQLEATGAWGNLPSDLDGSSLDLPRSTYLGAAWNQWNRVNQQTQFGIEHRLDGDWTLRLDAAHTRLRMTGDEGFKQSYFTRASNADPYLFNVTTSVYSGDQSDQDVVSLIADGPFE
ncbi:TonB-dependent siderophore receptor, partial [Rubrivivax gelatinosus]|nr:TonB-dependent siderophore receptor [Rubrivivax gelatinosus]